MSLDYDIVELKRAIEMADARAAKIISDRVKPDRKLVMITLDFSDGSQEQRRWS